MTEPVDVQAARGSSNLLLCPKCGRKLSWGGKCHACNRRFP